MAASIGIMDSAYFVGRNEILTWINDRLHLNLSRVEEVILFACHLSLLLLCLIIEGDSFTCFLQFLRYLAG